MRVLLLSKGSVSAMKGFSSGFSSAYASNGSIVRVLLLFRAPRLESVNCFPNRSSRASTDVSIRQPTS